MSARSMLIEDQLGLVDSVSDRLLGEGYRVHVDLHSHAPRETTIEFRTEDAPGPIHLNPGIELDFASRQLCRGGELVPVSALEFRLLEYLWNNRDRIVTRDELLRNVWGYDPSVFTRTVDVHMARLRKKIESDPAHPTRILTVAGQGYQFVSPSAQLARAVQA